MHGSRVPPGGEVTAAAADFLGFLTGGGEVGALMRARDWSSSPLGPPDGWPQSLRSVVGLMLGSKFPMFAAWGPELGFLYNDSYAELLGAKHPAALGDRFHDIWAEVWPDISPLIDAALDGRATFHEDMPLTVNRRGYDERAFFTFSYSPVHDESGAVTGMFCAVNETTGRIEAEKRIAAEGRRFAELFDQAPAFLAVLRGPEHVFELTNPAYLRLIGHRDVLGRRVVDTLPDVVEQGYVDLLDQVYRTGEPYVATGARYAMQANPGAAVDQRVVDFVFQPIADKVGTTSGILVHGVDVTNAHQVSDALGDETRRLETLNRTGTALAAELDLERLLQMVTDAGVELTGAAYGAFFHNVLDDTGERLHLYTLSGADRSAFEKMGGVRATGVFGPTFRNEGVVRADDILVDPRYGRFEPHHGMPDGHLPVRSYLAVPVASRSGAVLGGLVFGHPEPGRFTDRHERLMLGIAAQAAVAIDNAHLFQAEQSLNETLEQRVAERTLELEKAHDALRQAQKMEAVGQLTGGIAHDFNNMLAIVIGSLDLLRRRVVGDDQRARRYLDAATDGARRAALLTQRLLAFSRRQPLRPEPVDVNKLVGGMSDLLRHSIGAEVQLEAALADGLWRTHADPNQLENAILNLAVNARDAMPDGGRLTVATGNAHVDQRDAAGHAGLTPGQYVLIALSDTGSGMSDEVIAKAFDPFYTTKEVGKGTGLGLSQVYGFVKQSGGYVKIESQPGQGATVKIYLPRHLGANDEEKVGGDALDLPLGEREEIVLVVEDEPGVRQFSTDALGELGYRVLEADGAAAALRLLDAHPEIALMFTDVVMPEVNGAKLAEEARRRRSDLKILFTTGYKRDAVVHDGVLDPQVELLGKPFTIEELAAKVRSVLDAAVAR